MIAIQATSWSWRDLFLMLQISLYQLDTDASETSASVLQNYKISAGLTSPKVHFKSSFTIY